MSAAENARARLMLSAASRTSTAERQAVLSVSEDFPSCLVGCILLRAERAFFAHISSISISSSRSISISSRAISKQFLLRSEQAIFTTRGTKRNAGKFHVSKRCVFLAKIKDRGSARGYFSARRFICILLPTHSLFFMLPGHNPYWRSFGILIRFWKSGCPLSQTRLNWYYSTIAPLKRN
jgi:hypothetical protein